MQHAGAVGELRAVQVHLQLLQGEPLLLHTLFQQLDLTGKCFGLLH